VLLAVTGGIAAYKSPEVVRAFVKQGVEVQVIMTEAARAFATEMSLAVVSGRPARWALLDASEEGSVGHIELADWPDLVVVAPATADVIAKGAGGVADNLVTTCLLATRAPVLWAPAMNTNMWRHPATRANLATLASRGARFVGPDRGPLACGWVGEGRMIDPDQIVEAALAELRGMPRPWTGRRVLVSAGPTRAYLDPVRFFTNASSGAMGFAVAEMAAMMGADVTLVAGPVQRHTPSGVQRIDVETAPQMLEAMDRVLTEAPQDLVAMVAAVADLAPAAAAEGKFEKAQLLEQLRAGAFVEGIDVLATLTARHVGRAYFLGFGAQTVDPDEAEAEVEAALIHAGQRKLASKGCDALFVNRVGVPGLGFASETNAGVLLVRTGGDALETIVSGPAVAKRELAAWLLEQLSSCLPPVRRAPGEDTP
jgi:phosphopantothenoylcysteine decarboxylase/phosphopantothenate--cysteine ligase